MSFVKLEKTEDLANHIAFSKDRVVVLLFSASFAQERCSQILDVFNEFVKSKVDGPTYFVEVSNDIGQFILQ